MKPLPFSVLILTSLFTVITQQSPTPVASLISSPFGDQNLTAFIPVTPPSFRIFPQGSARELVPVGELFHLLFSVIVDRYCDDASAAIQLPYRMISESATWAFVSSITQAHRHRFANGRTMIWIAGRVLTSCLRSMGDDDMEWSVPKEGYMIWAESAPKLGKAMIRSLDGLRIGENGTVHNATGIGSISGDFSVDGAAPDNSTDSPIRQADNAEESLTDPSSRADLAADDPGDDTKIGSKFFLSRDEKISRKAAVLLFAEFIQRVLIAKDPQLTIADDVRGKGRVWLSDPIDGVSLRVHFVRDELASGVSVKMKHIAIALHITTRELAQEKGDWCSFHAFFYGDDAAGKEYWASVSLVKPDELENAQDIPNT